jgi:hypothetical protein
LIILAPISRMEAMASTMTPRIFLSIAIPPLSQVRVNTTCVALGVVTCSLTR